MKKNYKFTIAYDGTRYFGWEHQPDQEMTIQGKLERVLSVMANTQVEVIGAGRTDAGVHAKGMVANAHLDTELEPDGIRDYMNRYLPDDICRIFIRYKAVLVIRCLFISVRYKGSNALPVPPLYFKLAFYFCGYVPAIRIVDKIFDRKYDAAF